MPVAASVACLFVQSCARQKAKSKREKRNERHSIQCDSSVLCSRGTLCSFKMMKQVFIADLNDGEVEEKVDRRRAGGGTGKTSARGGGGGNSSKNNSATFMYDSDEDDGKGISMNVPAPRLSKEKDSATGKTIFFGARYHAKEEPRTQYTSKELAPADNDDDSSSSSSSGSSGAETNKKASGAVNKKEPKNKEAASSDTIKKKKKTSATAAAAAADPAASSSKAKSSVTVSPTKKKVTTSTTIQEGSGLKKTKKKKKKDEETPTADIDPRSDALHLSPEQPVHSRQRKVVVEAQQLPVKAPPLAEPATAAAAAAVVRRPRRASMVESVKAKLEPPPATAAAPAPAAPAAVVRRPRRASLEFMGLSSSNHTQSSGETTATSSSRTRMPSIARRFSLLTGAHISKNFRPTMTTSSESEAFQEDETPPPPPPAKKAPSSKSSFDSTEVKKPVVVAAAAAREPPTKDEKKSLKKTAVVAAATPPKAEKKAKDPHPSAGFSSPSEPLAATATAIKEEKKWKKKSMAAAALPSKAEKKVKDTPASTARSSPESTEDRPPVAIPAVATATSSTLPPMEETKSKQTSVAAPPPPEDEEMANDPPPFARTSSDTAEEEEEEAATIAAFPPNEDKKLKWALAVPQPPPPVHSTDWQNPVVSSASPTPSPKEEKKLKKPGTVVPQAREEKKVRDASPSATSSSDSTDLQKPVVAASLKKLKKPLVTTELQKPVVAASPKKLRKSSVTGPPTKAEETAKDIPQDSSSSSESTTVKNPIVETPAGPSQQPKIQKKLQKPAVEEPKKEKKATEKKTFDANFTVNQWNKGRQQLETIPWSKTKKTREELREENASNNVPARPPLDVFQRPLVVKDDYQAPVYTKSKHEEKTIERALSKVLPLDNMLKRGVSKLIAAFEKTHVGAGTEIGGEDDCDEDGEDYFYVVQDGKVGVEVDGEEVGELNGGGTIGDVNLFHPSKRGAASFRTKSDVDLFRMNQSTYRSIFQSENIREDKHKLGLVEKIRLFDNTSDANKKKLSYALKPITFKEGEIVVSKHNYGNFFYIVDSGRVRCRDPDRLGRKVPDRIVTSGGYFGDTLLASNDPRSEEVLAETNVKAYRIDGSTFETAIGKPRNVILTPEEAANLQCISELQYKPGKKLKKDQVKNIAAKIVDHTFAKGQTILEAGVEIPAAIYFVRQGVAKVVSGRYNKLKANGDYFGEDLFENARSCCSLVGATRFPVTAVDTLVCGVLKLEDYLSVFEDAAPKTKAKKPKRETIEESEHESEPKQDDEETKTADESMHEETQTSVQVDKVDNKSRRREFKFCNLVKKVMLGEGQFGQVWMVADTTEEPQRPYALKIQSKYELVEQDQAEVCVREKNIMALLDHPMVIKLFASFHDQDFVYLLLDMVNGGELFNLIHQSDGNGLPEKHCKFYAFVLADIISYIHGKNYVYRDLKPENVLIGNSGYPVLIDFGFAKKITGKTFTLCGTPGYLSPEIVSSQGHTFSADHWAYGVLVYEMLCGYSPFYEEGIEPTELYRSISEDDYEPPEDSSDLACDFLSKLLEKDPVFRLGSLAGGESDITSHPWFDGMDPSLVRKQALEVPWRPELSDPFDVRHFDDWSEIEDKSLGRYPRLKPKHELIFDDFDVH